MNKNTRAIRQFPASNLINRGVKKGCDSVMSKEIESKLNIGNQSNYASDDWEFLKRLPVTQRKC